MALFLCPLFSGSSGNAIFVSNGETHILVDAGKSGRSVENALKSIQVDPAQLSAILVTHEHFDHIAAVGVLSRKYNLPVFATSGSWAGMGRIGPINPRNKLSIEILGSQYADFYIGRLNVQAFKTSHDSRESVGYILSSDGASIGIATDLGVFPNKLYDIFYGLDLLLLESNHDEAMLSANPNYTAELKKRILGKRGHLSNTHCAEAIVKLYSKGLTHFILAHLSDENNSPELAMETVVNILCQNGIDPDDDIVVNLAPRDECGNFYHVRAKDESDLDVML